MAESKQNPMVLIQTRLNAPKNQRNTFGNYNYRSCEDILEALKPLLKETGCVLNVSDEIQQVADRIYVRATATLTTPDGKTYQASAYAREPLTKKGMDDAQITGATSSYARKYALNGLFCIDDNKDADITSQQPAIAPQQESITDESIILLAISQSRSESELLSVYNRCDKALFERVKTQFSKRKAELQKGGAQ